MLYWNVAIPSQVDPIMEVAPEPTTPEPQTFDFKEVSIGVWVPPSREPEDGVLKVKVFGGSREIDVQHLSREPLFDTTINGVFLDGGVAEVWDKIDKRKRATNGRN